MIDPIHVEFLDPTPPTPNADEVRALVKIEELRLERTKIRSGAVVIAIGLLSWAAVCHATCGV